MAAINVEDMGDSTGLPEAEAEAVLPPFPFAYEEEP
jgi:hypothetical protein